MNIRLTTNARVLGVLRSPAEGVISVPATEGRRLIDVEKVAEDASPTAAKKPSKKSAKPKKARARSGAAKPAKAPASPPAAAPPGAAGADVAS